MHTQSHTRMMHCRVLMPPTSIVLLLLPGLVASSRFIVTPSWQLQTAVVTIGALECASGPRPLSLLDGLFDAESGLCSEGVWHNSMLGVSRVLCARQLRQCGEEQQAEAQLQSARLLGDSLFDLGFDGSGFRRRSTSGYWQDASASGIEAAGESVPFYLPSDEHRCLGSAAAVIFYSLLAEDGDEAAMSRCVEIGDAFVDEMFDRSAMRFRRAASSEYWRAVDQALGLLACLRLAVLGHNVASNRAMASCAADSLLREFGYSLYATEGLPPGAYLGRVAPRNSWHDSIVAFALLTSGCLGVGGESPAGLLRAMVESYRNPDGQIRHLPRELCPAEGVADTMEAAVAFTSTQGLWSAVVRAADLSSSRADAVDADTAALRSWHESYVQETGLLPVANVYADARLWANTEWAAWLLLDRGDFVLKSAASSS